MKNQTKPPLPGKSDIVGDEAMLSMNEALVLGSIRQHELTATAVAANARLKVEIAERKRAEKRLQFSESRYRQLFEMASDGVLVVDPVAATITDANPQMTRLTGRPRDLIVGKPLWEIGLFGDPAASRRLLTDLESLGEIHLEELPLDRLDGHHQTVEVVAISYLEDKRPVIKINIRDITARKLADDILRRNEALFTAIIELSPAGVFVLDVKFRMQQVNPEAMHVFKNVHPLIGRDFGEILNILWPNPTADEVVGIFRHTLETGESYQSPEFTERRKDTGVVEVYEYQTLGVTLPDGDSGLVCFFNNITERKNDEAARRTLAVLTASNVKLKKEIVRRKAVEESLQQNQQLQILLLEQSKQQEEQLRDLSHRVLHAQEDERNRISRELHDVISQNLIGINVNIAALANGDPAADPEEFQRKIASTQEIVEDSVKRVHDFARELRPAVLDDLGLIPALHSHLRAFMKETGIRSTLSAFAGIEQANDNLRTALYRIAQEALTNISRHAQASQVAVSITLLDGVVQMEIQDDGIGFQVAGSSHAVKENRLGLLGMKERIEMLGGCFQVESSPGNGTTVRVSLTNLCP